MPQPMLGPHNEQKVGIIRSTALSAAFVFAAFAELPIFPRRPARPSSDDEYAYVILPF
jgi:hypothetical protein